MGSELDKTNWRNSRVNEQNILQVLNDIQAENGAYYQLRQDLNRDIRNKQAFITDISKDIPENYQAEKWQAYNLGEKYTELETIRAENNKIEQAKMLKDSYDNKLRGLQAERDIATSSAEKVIANEREGYKVHYSKGLKLKSLLLKIRLQDWIVN